MHPALLYKKLDNNEVECCLCAHNCRIKKEERGRCMVRQNNNGELFTLAYGGLSHANPGLIESKGLFHFLPGSKVFSIATPGCNFSCEFCQNADVSQFGKEEDEDEEILESLESIVNEATPESIVTAAEQTDCTSLAYTYTEPTVFFELASETAKIAQERGLSNIFITNGYLTSEAIKIIKPYLDAVNIDLKSFTAKFYKQTCGAELKPVLQTIKEFYKAKVWIEITTLIIHKLNDSTKELKQIAQFIAKLDKNIPWHLTRFEGAFRMIGYPDTPEETLIKAAEIGQKAGLNYVYIKNSTDLHYTHTQCPKCGEMVIERHLPAVTNELKKDGKCPHCHKKINGVFG